MSNAEKVTFHWEKFKKKHANMMQNDKLMTTDYLHGMLKPPLQNMCKFGI
jgi:hypothetical protein